MTCTQEKFQVLRNTWIARNFSDDGFMGFTHALSAIALALTLIALAPATVHLVLGVSDPWILVTATLVSAGFALFPDLDNTTATARNAYGFVGVGLSTFFRSTSLIVQTLIRKKADDSDPDPHRGFWHTVPASILIGLAIFGLTRFETSITIPWLGEITVGQFLGYFVIFGALHLMLAALAKPTVDKIKKGAGPFGTLAAVVLSISLTVVLVVNLPTEIDFWWLGVTAAFGCIVHIIGDGLTSSGVPLFFPIVGLWRNKLWWKTRIPPSFKAGGTIENVIIVPLFSIVSVIMLGIILF